MKRKIGPEINPKRRRPSKKRMFQRPDPNRKEPIGPIIPPNRFLHKAPHVSEIPQFDANLRGFFTNEERRTVTNLRQGPDMSFTCLSTPTMFQKPMQNGCPPFLQRRGECCTLLDNPGQADSEETEFLEALKNCIRNVRYRNVSRRIFGVDFMEWYQGNNTGNANVTDVELRSDSRFRDVFLQFLFRALPMLEINLLDPVENELVTIFSSVRGRWELTPEFDDILRLMRETGVEGEVQYTYPHSLAPRPMPLNCSKMIHVVEEDRGMLKYMDVTHVPELFASDGCGYKRRKDIIVREIGVLEKRLTFYEFLFNLIVSMPPINCMFMMKIDDGSNPDTMRIDSRHNRIFPLHHIVNPQSTMTGSDAIDPILHQLGQDLPGHHRPVSTVVGGGNAVGNWSTRLWENGVAGSGSYFLRLACNGNGTDAWFIVGKGMLPP